MSDQDRDRIAQTDDDEGTEEVEAHRIAATDGDAGDDVEAHSHGVRGALGSRGADDDGDDDVEAHSHGVRG